MNTTVVDVTEIKGVLLGQEVVPFGQQQKQSIEVSEMENNAELIFLSCIRCGEPVTHVST